jgi:sterol desaturase/sphingolipid hydroxylase (fatty acid hydroxylase superfamily)
VIIIGFQMAWLALLGVVELLASEWPRLVSGQRRRVRNLAFTVINHVSIPPASLLLVHWLPPLGPSHWLGSLPVHLGLPLAIVVFDVAGYWFHRVSHRSALLWRLHQIHHLDEDFDFTTGARVHTVEAILQYGVLVAVATALGIPHGYLAVFSTVSFTMALLHHSKIAIPASIEKWLRQLIITPALRVPHHHDQIQDTDTNFGFIFPWWDRMFGTYNTRARTPQWRIGLDYSNDLRLARLAIQPFIPTPLKVSATAPAPRPVRTGELEGAK